MSELVLVTGGAGFVGSHVTRMLLERGHDVRVLDNFLYGDLGLAELGDHPRLEIVSGDICDPVALGGAVRGASRVIALAALVGDAACDLHPERTMAINFESTRALIQACRQHDVRRLVFASSCSVYGANGSTLLTEESQLNPVSLYGRTRLMSEDMLRSEAEHVPVVILRLATVCGSSPRMRFDLMVNTMTAFACRQGVVRVSGAGQWRPHVHVRDAARAFVMACETDAPGALVLNVGSEDQNFTIGEVAERVAERIGGVRIDPVAANGDRRSYRVSFDRIRDTLGFVRSWGVDDAIGEVQQLLGGPNGLSFDDERYHNLKWLSSRILRKGAA